MDIRIYSNKKVEHAVYIDTINRSLKTLYINQYLAWKKSECMIFSIADIQ